MLTGTQLGHNLQSVCANVTSVLLTVWQSCLNVIFTAVSSADSATDQALHTHTHTHTHITRDTVTDKSDKRNSHTLLHTVYSRFTESTYLPSKTFPRRSHFHGIDVSHKVTFPETRLPEESVLWSRPVPVLGVSVTTPRRLVPHRPPRRPRANDCVRGDDIVPHSEFLLCPDVTIILAVSHNANAHIPTYWVGQKYRTRIVCACEADTHVPASLNIATMCFIEHRLHMQTHLLSRSSSVCGIFGPPCKSV